MRERSSSGNINVTTNTMADEINDPELEEEVKDEELNTDDTPTDDNGEAKE